MKKSAILISFILTFCLIFTYSCAKKENSTNYFEFHIIDETTFINEDSLSYLEKGTYMVIYLNKRNKLPETLIIPSEYNGIKVTAIGDGLLDGANVKTLVIPQSIKLVGYNLCGLGASCPTLEKIVCLSDTPFYLVSFALNGSQLNGGCKIYVPENAVDNYKSFDIGGWKSYTDLITTYSNLDDETKNYIQNKMK